MSNDPRFDPAKKPKKRAATPKREGRLPVDPRELASPLYSADAEKAVLSSMMAHPEAVADDILAVLERNAFFVPANQEIFTAMKEMWDARQPIDMTTIHQWLADRKLADQVGSYAYLAEVAGTLVTHLNATTHVKIVMDKWTLRRLQGVCINIVQAISDDPSKVDDIQDDAERSILEITSEDRGFVEKPFLTVVDDVVRAVEEAKAAGRVVTGLPSGFWRLDDLTTGWQSGDMIVLGARPGIGKTALAMRFMIHLLNPRYHEQASEEPDPAIHTHLASLEMMGKQLGGRWLSMHAGIQRQKLRTGRINETETKAMISAAREMRQWPLHLDDTAHLEVGQWRARLRRAKKKHGIKLAVIDYLQLLTCKKYSGHRQNEVAEISRVIKSTALELGIPILVMSQLNRKKEDDGGDDEEPKLHHLRESGAIEQDADIVMLLHRTRETQGKHQVYKLILAKQRDGASHVDIRIGFNAREVLFEEIHDAEVAAKLGQTEMAV